MLLVKLSTKGKNKDKSTLKGEQMNISLKTWATRVRLESAPTTRVSLYNPSYPYDPSQPLRPESAPIRPQSTPTTRVSPYDPSQPLRPESAPTTRVNPYVGKNVRPALRLWGESPEGHLLTRRFGSSVAIWLRN